MWRVYNSTGHLRRHIALIKLFLTKWNKKETDNKAFLRSIVQQ